jgi:hypothetical protein
MTEKYFSRLLDKVTHNETMKKIYINMCLKQMHFGAMALWNFRKFMDKPG